MVPIREKVCYLNFNNVSSSTVVFTVAEANEQMEYLLDGKQSTPPMNIQIIKKVTNIDYSQGARSFLEYLKI